MQLLHSNRGTFILFAVLLLASARPASAQVIIYVDASATGAFDGTDWKDAFTDLQVALGAAGVGNEIRVAAGTYTPAVPADRTATFQLAADVPVYGGFPPGGGARDPDDTSINETTLSGEIGAATIDDNCYNVVIGASGSTLDRFTITRGNANGGGAVTGRGGGYHCRPSGSMQTITDCCFLDNAADQGGGFAGATATAELTRCLFLGNSATDDGGGLHDDDSASLDVVNCVFSGNSAGNRGGGLYSQQGSIRVINCTFSCNTAVNSGGGAYINGSNNEVSLMFNCVLFGNTAPNSPDLRGSHLCVHFTLYGAGVVTSLSNCNQPLEGLLIGVDPLFVDPDGDDDTCGTKDDVDGLRVFEDSPLIGAGMESYDPLIGMEVFAPMEDINLIPRDPPLNLGIHEGFVLGSPSDPPDDPPVVDAGPDQCVASGTMFMGSFTISDPDSTDWSVTIDFNDPSPDLLEFDVTRTAPSLVTVGYMHLFPMDLDVSYDVTITVTDDGLPALGGMDTLTVTVRLGCVVEDLIDQLCEYIDNAGLSAHDASGLRTLCRYITLRYAYRRYRMSRYLLGRFQSRVDQIFAAGRMTEPVHTAFTDLIDSILDIHP